MLTHPHYRSRLRTTLFVTFMLLTVAAAERSNRLLARASDYNLCCDTDPIGETSCDDPSPYTACSGGAQSDDPDCYVWWYWWWDPDPSGHHSCCWFQATCNTPFPD